MNAILLSLVLALVLDQGSATQRMVVRLSHQSNAPSLFPALACITIIVVAAAASLGGTMANLLGQEARLCFLGAALIIGGGSMLTGAVISASAISIDSAPMSSTLAVFFLRRASENSALAVAGTATFTTLPLLAGIGGMIGCLAGFGLARTFDSRTLTNPPFSVVCLVLGSSLLCAGIGCIANALHLI